MKSRAFAVVGLASLLLAGCSFPSGIRPAVPRVAATPSGNQAVASEYLTRLSVLSYDPFEDLRNWNSQPTTGALVNGIFEMRGTGFWQSHVLYKEDFAEGQGLLINFSVKFANARSELVLVSGDWLTSSFRQFGMYNGPRPLSDLFQGTVDLGGNGLPGNLSLSPGTTYELLLAVGHTGHLLAVAWDPASPSDRATFDIQGDTSWAGRTWTFMPKAAEGEVISLDDFYRIAFADVK